MIIPAGHEPDLDEAAYAEFEGTCDKCGNEIPEDQPYFYEAFQPPFDLTMHIPCYWLWQQKAIREFEAFIGPGD